MKALKQDPCPSLPQSKANHGMCLCPSVHPSSNPPSHILFHINLFTQSIHTVVHPSHLAICSPIPLSPPGHHSSIHLPTISIYPFSLTCSIYPLIHLSIHLSPIPIQLPIPSFYPEPDGVPGLVFGVVGTQT